MKKLLILAKAHKMGEKSLNKEEKEYYDKFIGRQEIIADQKTRDLSPIDISIYYKTLEERKALKMAKKDFKLYNIAHPSDGKVLKTQTCGGHPYYKGFTLAELLEIKTLE